MTFLEEMSDKIQNKMSRLKFYILVGGHLNFKVSPSEIDPSVNHLYMRYESLPRNKIKIFKLKFKFTCLMKE